MDTPAIYRGHIPFVRFLLALLAGIGVGFVVTPNSTLWIVLWVMLFFSVIGFFLVYRISRLRNALHYGFIGLLFLLSLFLMGWILLWRTHPNVDKYHFSQQDADVMIGYVADEPVLRGEHVRFPFKVISGQKGDSKQVLSGQLMLTIRLLDSTKSIPFEYGEALALPADYQEVAPPMNPGEMNYKVYLANRNIWHQAYLQYDGLVRLEERYGNPIIAYALQLRQQMVDKFGRYIADRDAHAVASTLILGYRADLSQDVLNSFSATGTIHVLSVSGMHVVIVFVLLEFMLRWMNRSHTSRLLQWTIMLLCVWWYALITGFSPSVLRAAIMITFVITASRFGQKSRIYNSIAASAFFLLLYKPTFIADIGFQLSYLAVIFIVFLMPILQEAMPVENKLLKPIWSYSLMSVSAQVGAFPLATFYFHQFPLYFLPANLLIVLPATLIMYLGFALLLLPEISFLAWMGIVLEKLIVFMNSSLAYIEQLPMSSMRGIWYAHWEYLLIYLFILALVFSVIYRQKREVYVMLGSLLLLSGSYAVYHLRKSETRLLVVHNVRSDIAISIVDQRQTILYSNLPSPEDRTLQYAVMTYLESFTAASRVNFVRPDESFHQGHFFVENNVLQIGDRRLLVIEDDTRYAKPLRVDIVIIRSNPRIELVELLNNITASVLILDGSNYPSTVERLLAEAEVLGLNTYVLKNNFAYVWELDRPAQ